jgi:hypothetical protein
MATTPIREPISPERALALASRREIRGHRGGWLAALAMVVGIAAASVLLRTWHAARAPLPTTALDVALMQAPALEGGHVATLIAASPERPATRHQAPTREATPARSETSGGPALSGPNDGPAASAPAAEPRVERQLAEIPMRPLALVAMRGPLVEPDSLGAVEPPVLDAPFASIGAAAPRLVGRAVVAAGRGIAAGFRVTGASIRSAF